MKTILQKHTSKFVANLLNGLGIIACIALTSCGDQDKSKQTENQGEDLKNGLIGKGLGEDEVKAIADWLNSNGKDSTYKLTAKDLQEIFQNDSSKLNEVAKKLGVKLTESEDEPDDEKKKEINEWLNKLNSLENDEFTELGGDLKEKVAQKFIASGIGINEVTVIKEKLAGFINEVVEAKKASEITLKVEGNGTVTITNVFDQKTTDFVFGEIKNLQGFVDALKGKEITDVDGELSFAFGKENVKICGHGTGFKVTDCFEKFFTCFNTLVGFEKLKIQNLSLKIDQSTLSLNEVQMSDDYFKTVGFWTLVKDHAARFGITEEKNKFEIEKEGDEENATVKIGNLETQLKWNGVVGGENTFKEDSKWGNIFKFKNEEKPAEAVTVEFKADGLYSLNNVEAELKTLDNLKTFVESVKGKTVTVGENKKVAFSVKDGKTITVKVDMLVGFDVEINNKNFSDLLGFVGDLKDVKLVEDNFKFKVEAGDNAITFGGTSVADKFLVSKEAWEVIKGKKDLFDFNGGIKVVKSENSDKYVKIGELSLNFDVLNGNGNSMDCVISDDWKEIFTLN